MPLFRGLFGFNSSAFLYPVKLYFRSWHGGQLSPNSGGGCQGSSGRICAYNIKAPSFGVPRRPAAASSSAPPPVRGGSVRRRPTCPPSSKAQERATSSAGETEGPRDCLAIVSANETNLAAGRKAGGLFFSLMGSQRALIGRGAKRANDLAQTERIGLLCRGRRWDRVRDMGAALTADSGYALRVQGRPLVSPVGPIVTAADAGCEHACGLCEAMNGGHPHPPDG